MFREILRNNSKSAPHLSPRTPSVREPKSWPAWCFRGRLASPWRRFWVKKLRESSQTLHFLGPGMRIYWFHWVQMILIDIPIFAMPSKGTLIFLTKMYSIGFWSGINLTANGWRKVEIGKWFLVFWEDILLYDDVYHVFSWFRIGREKVVGGNSDVKWCRQLWTENFFF